jgi:hypothetical protein
MTTLATPFPDYEPDRDLDDTAEIEAVPEAAPEVYNEEDDTVVLPVQRGAMKFGSPRQYELTPAGKRELDRAEASCHPMAECCELTVKGKAVLRLLA